MQKQEKTFLALLVVFAFLGMLAFSNSFFLDNAHAVTQYFIAGNSTGKLVITIVWLSLLPLICFIALRCGIAKKLEKKHGLFFTLFIITAVLLFSIGLAQFYYFSLQYDNQTVFATLLAEGNYTNWEASKVSHNHFMKAGLYFLEKNLGINAGASFDDGKPLYSVFSNSGLWGALLAGLVVLLVVFAILHCISKSQKTSAFDFLLFALASLSIAVHSLDGGIATGTAVLGIFLLVLYALRERQKEESEFKNIMPLAFSALVFVIVAAVSSTDVLTAWFSIPLLLTIGLGYCLAKELQENRLEKNKLANAALAIVFLLALSNAMVMFNVFAEGKWVIDFSKENSVKTSLSGDGLFIYGIPENTITSELMAELEKYGVIEEFYRAGWVAYARIIPNASFRTLSLEKKLKEKFSTKGYFYVEEAPPVINTSQYTLYLLKNEKPVKFDESFLGLKVLRQEYNAEKHAIILSIQGKYDNTWQMLAILEEARQKGLEKQALLAK